MHDHIIGGVLPIVSRLCGHLLLVSCGLSFNYAHCMEPIETT